MLLCLRPHHRSRGFSLVESTIVLGVVGLVVSGIWVASSALDESRKRARFMEELMLVSQNLRQYYGDVKVPITMTFADDTHAGITMPKTSWPTFLPLDMIDAHAVYPISPWGKTLNVSIVPWPTGNAVQFQLTFLSLSSCVFLGPRIYASIKGMFPPNAAASGYLQTSSDGYDISTPALASVGCKSELDAEESINILITLPL